MEAYRFLRISRSKTRRRPVSARASSITRINVRSFHEQDNDRMPHGYFANGVFLFPRKLKAS